MKFIPLFLLLPLLSFSQYPYEALTTEVGIDAMIGGLPDNNLRDLGSGVSVVDFNGDGYDDIVMATGEDLPVLFYLNDGDGTFSEIPSPINNVQFQKMPLFGDIDNDGDQDLLVNGDGYHNRIYRNDGNLVFKDITIASKIHRNDAESYGASFCDVDADGYLDIYITNRHKGTYPNYLYMNNGDNTFTEEGVLRGVADDLQLSHQSLFFDYDNDGDQDLYVINDRLYRNSLFNNDGKGFFTDVSQESGTDIRIDAMNCSAGDIDNDGNLEIFITNNGAGGGGDRLLYNNGNGTFTDMSDETSANVSYFTWAGIWFDYDNDTDQDLFVASMKDEDPSVLLTNYLVELGFPVFLNSWPAGLPESHQSSFSAAFFDYDNDGKLDFVMPNAGPDSYVQVWHNTVDNANNWVKFKLEGVYSNRDGVGTRIELFLADQMYIRNFSDGDGYLTQNHKQLHFGLGTAATIDSVNVKWPSGIVDKYYDLEINQLHDLLENASNPIEIEIDSDNPTCADYADGSILITPLSGTPPYTIEWSNGESDMDIDELSSGNYVATVTDATGERGVAFVNLQDPEALLSDIAEANDSGAGDGEANVAVNGGMPEYSYNWDVGGDNPSIGSLSEGVYFVDITDANGCVITDYAVIYDESGPCAANIATEVETTSSTVTISWGNVPNAEKFRIIYRALGDENWISGPSSTTNSFYIDKLSPSTEYEYRTRTNCVEGDKSEWSDTYLFTTDEIGPECETWVATEIYVDNNSVLIILDDVYEASSYRLRFRPIGAIEWFKRTSKYSMFILEPIDEGTMYEYQGATRCGNGWTEWSDLDYFETEGDGLLAPDLTGFRNSDTQNFEAELMLFPNPVMEELKLAITYGTPSQLVIRDIQGKDQIAQSLSASGAVIDVSDLATGIYVVTILLEDGQLISQRFVKK